MNLEQRKPTHPQRVFDALSDRPMTMTELMEATGLRYQQLREAFRHLGQEKYECDQAPRYSLKKDTLRPKDQRGRRRAG